MKLTPFLSQIELDSDCVALAFRPDGDQIAVSTLNGVISLWHPSTAQQVGTTQNACIFNLHLLILGPNIL